MHKKTPLLGRFLVYKQIGKCRERGLIDYAPVLTLEPLENQRRVGATEAEAVGHNTVQRDACSRISYHVHTFSSLVECFNVGRRSDEVVFHHE